MARVVAVLAAVAVVAALAPSAAASDTGALAGRVTAAGGDPVPEAVVHVVRQVGGSSCRQAAEGCPDPVATTADEEGAWSVSGLEPGDYHVHAADPAGERAHAWREDLAEVLADDVTAGVDVSLPPAARVEGVVTVRGQDPVRGALVQAAQTFFHTAEAETAGDGRFTLSGLAAGEQEVSVTPAHGGLGDAEVSVALAEGETTNVEVDLALLPIDLRRIAGRTRIETAVEASRTGFDAAEQVVIATADAFPDALAAAPLAAALGGPLLLVGERLHPDVLAEIRRLGAAEAVVVGGTGAVPLAVDLDLERAGVSVRRAAGEHRFDTAGVIALQVGGDSGEAIVASGENFPDALSAAPLAAAAGIPILLTPVGSLDQEAAAALQQLGAERTIVVGGEAAVSRQAAGALPSPTRIFGPERYATSAALAEYGFERGVFDLSTVAVATGRNFPDALAAGPVAANIFAPVLLVDGEDPGGAGDAFAFLRRHAVDVGAVWVFGGEAAVSGPVADRVASEAGP